MKKRDRGALKWWGYLAYSEPPRSGKMNVQMSTKVYQFSPPMSWTDEYLALAESLEDFIRGRRFASVCRCAPDPTA